MTPLVALWLSVVSARAAPVRMAPTEVLAVARTRLPRCELHWDHVPYLGRFQRALGLREPGGGATDWVAGAGLLLEEMGPAREELFEFYPPDAWSLDPETLERHEARKARLADARDAAYRRVSERLRPLVEAVDASVDERGEGWSDGELAELHGLLYAFGLYHDVHRLDMKVLMIQTRRRLGPEGAEAPPAVVSNAHDPLPSPLELTPLPEIQPVTDAAARLARSIIAHFESHKKAVVQVPADTDLARLSAALLAAGRRDLLAAIAGAGERRIVRKGRTHDWKAGFKRDEALDLADQGPGIVFRPNAG